MRDANAAVRLTNLTRRFGRQVAVDDVSLSVARGSVLGLIGPNGAGKSTTLRMVMGLLPVTTGEVEVLGVDVVADHEAVKGKVGYVPEQQTIYRWMTVGEVVRFCGRLYPTWNNALCEKLLAWFALPSGKKVKHLSKGMAAKLSLVVAMSHEPDLLILDEPTSGLDPVVREEFYDSVLEVFSDRRPTILMSSHTLGDVQRLADSIALMYEGCVIAHRPTDRLLDGTRRIRATLKDGALPGVVPGGAIYQHVDRREWTVTVMDFEDGMVERLRGEDAVEHVAVEPIGLEELFKDYVKGRRVK